MPANESGAVSILGFGDSLTAGTPGYDPISGYGNQRSQYGYWLVRQAKEERQMVLEFDNQGVPGDLARHMLQRLHSVLARRNYHIAVILAGSNDLGWGERPDAVFGYLNTLWQCAREEGSSVIACTIPPVGVSYPPLQEAQLRLNEKVVEAVRGRDQQLVVDLFSAMSDERGLLQPDFDSGDGLHMNKHGYRRMGETIWRDGIRQMLDSLRGH